MAQQEHQGWQVIQIQPGAIAAIFFAFSVMSGLAEAAPMTGVFSGQGRECDGNLYLRTKTIEWNTPYSMCSRTKYRIITKTFSNTPKMVGDHIVFALKNIGKTCHYPFIGLYYYGRGPNTVPWSAVGFPDYGEYKKFNFIAVTKGGPWPPSVLLCDQSEASASHR